MRTLQLNRSLFRNALALILCMAPFLGALEVLARTNWAYQNLPTPDLRSSNAQFEIKIAILDHLVRNGYNIDCAFLGSSMAESALDPTAFNRGYLKATGSPIACVNISLDGLTSQGAEALARLMIQRYKARLIIWGTSARDYTQKGEAYWSEWHTRVLGPWGLHVLGEPNLEGWWLDHSYAYRYSIRLQRFVSQKDYARAYKTHYQRIVVDSYGYEPRYEVDPLVDLTQSPADSEQRELFGDEGQISAVALDHLASLANLNTDNSQILLVELPVHPTYYEYFQGGQTQFKDILTQAQLQAETHQLLFWPQSLQPRLPRTAWNDRYHLRMIGASLLSEWLGEQVGAAVAAGDLRDPLAVPSR